MLAPGVKLRHYEIRRVIGQGGFGITYLARDSTLHRDVAIKEYLPTALALRDGAETVVPRSTETANDFLSGRERFLDEARTLAKLDHMPSVVRVLDFLEANGTAYMVMALARGETLAGRLRRDGPLDAAAIDRLLPPLLDGLEEVHGAGFLHRDIKPANILVDQRGLPTLIDFGAARAALAGSSVAMTAIFTPGYAAPEQFTAARQGPWTDIYGLAATLYEAITGRRPPSAFDRVLDDAYQPLARLAPPGWRRGLVEGIDQALSVHAANRPQSVAQWRKILMAEAAVDRPARVERPVADDTTIRAPPAARSGLAKTVWLGAGVLAILLLAGSYFLFAPTASFQPANTLADVDKEVERARAALAAAELAARRRAEEERQRLAEIEAKRTAEAEAAEKKRQEEEAQRAAAALTERDRQAAEAARLKAEADAAAKRQAEEEEEVKRRAAAEVEARRQSEAEIQRARDAVAAAEAARQKAEEEAARLRADAARRQAEAEALRQQQAEAAAAAEKKRLEDEARQKAAADAASALAAAEAAKRQADEADRKTAEAAEAALRLGPVDRQRLQVALTAQGFDTRGADGAFGARTREMIAAWQKARGLPATGFLTAAQQQALLKEGAAAIARFDDDEKKKAEEAKRKAEEEAKARAAAPAATPPAAAPPVPAAASRDGLWFGALDCKTSGRTSVQGNVSGGAGTLSGGNRTLRVQITGDSMTISVSTTVGGSAGQIGVGVGGGSGSMSGKLSGRSVYAQGSVGGDACTASLVGP